MATSMTSQDASFDQVFMKDRKLLEKIVSFADIRKDDTVLEVGPGAGALTELIAARCRKVIAVEKDERLAPALSGFRNVEVVFGNALEVIPTGLSYDVIVSNPPYSISEPLIKVLFGEQFRAAVLTLPSRFAKRLTSVPDDSHYSKLSLFSQSFFSIEALLHVGKDAWEPMPDTDSDVIRLTPKDHPSFRDSIIRELALQDDKKLKNALREAVVRCSGNTKRKARESVHGRGVPESVLEKKISEIGTDDMLKALSSF